VTEGQTEAEGSGTNNKIRNLVHS